MGKKVKKAPIALALALLLSSGAQHVNAQTVDDLYEMYGMIAPDAVPDDIRDTIMSYNNAQIYVVKYGSLCDVTTDYSRIKSQIEESKERVSQCHQQLADGYTLSVNTILKLESTILELEKKIEDMGQVMTEYEIQIPVIKPEDVPSKADYNSAINERSRYSAYNLGNVSNVKVPAVGQASVVQSGTTYTQIETQEASSALALFNGQVTEVDGDYIKIQSGNNVFVEYYGLISTCVQIGDKIEQYQRIGSVKNQFQVALNLSGDYYPLLHLFGGAQ